MSDVPNPEFELTSYPDGIISDATTSSYDDVSHLGPDILALLIADGRATPEVKSAFNAWFATATPDDVVKLMSMSQIDGVTGLRNSLSAQTIYDHDRMMLISEHERNIHASSASQLNVTKLTMFGSIIDIEAMGYANSLAMGMSGVDRYLLNPLASALKGIIRARDSTARIGGDEFAISGPSDTEFKGVLPKASVRLASRVLDALLKNPQFMVNYEADSLGLLIKSAQVDASMPWEDLKDYVDPKKGKIKGSYNFTLLPEGAQLHRVYKAPVEHAFRSLGYLTSDRDGGWFVPAKSKSELVEVADAISKGSIATDFDSYIELTSAEVPRPYIH